MFDEGELRPEAVVAKFATTVLDGKLYNVEHFALDVIIAVGYRVRSHRGTQFRVWATERLREYVVKGFALDDARLKRAGGEGYFDELRGRPGPGQGRIHARVQGATRDRRDLGTKTQRPRRLHSARAVSPSVTLAQPVPISPPAFFAAAFFFLVAAALTPVCAT